VRSIVWGLGLAYAVTGSLLELYHPDRLSSVRDITDGTGAVTATYRTEEFGTVTATTGNSTQPFGFTGEPRDATGLSYLRSRYYDPTLGRFVSQDPSSGLAAMPASMNRYVYANNNPTTLVDRSGRSSSSKTLNDANNCAQVGVGGRIVRVGLGSFLAVAGGGIAVAGGFVFVVGVSAGFPEILVALPEAIGYGGAIVGTGAVVVGSGVAIAISC
jgi:RHS repeat-associated protein